MDRASEGAEMIKVLRFIAGTLRPKMKVARAGNPDDDVREVTDAMLAMPALSMWAEDAEMGECLSRISADLVARGQIDPADIATPEGRERTSDRLRQELAARLEWAFTGTERRREAASAGTPPTEARH
jgi:hypothetical protein